MNKKELKKQYAQTLRPMGVYQVKNLANEKIFIDSSLEVNGRINRVKFQLDHGSYPNTVLQNDYKKFGVDKFVFEVIDYLEPKDDAKADYAEDLKMLEEMWIEKLQPFGEKGYNKKKLSIKN